MAITTWAARRRKRIKDASRKARTPWYELYRTPEWRNIRAQLIADKGSCETCGSTDHLRVDHIKPHRGNLALFHDTNNMMVMCRSCHNAKTASEQRGQQADPRTACGDDGMPIDPRHPWNSTS